MKSSTAVAPTRNRSSGDVRETRHVEEAVTDAPRRAEQIAEAELEHDKHDQEKGPRARYQLD
ncbi:MAG: hypothetical protein HY812_19250 [Planctomycetes bacterium]|nr:hypothetical protein [Planctomycetota bacterium]